MYAKAENFDALVKSFNDAFDGVSCVKNAYKGEIAFITDTAKESYLREKISGLAADSVKILNTLF